MEEHPRIVVTAMIEHQGRFLIISRPSDKKNFPGMWAFPGGKVELGETLLDALRREVREETGLEIKNESAFLNTFFDGNLVGAAFLVRAVNGNFKLTPEAIDYKWVSSTEELKGLKCIPGIHNHLVDAMKALERGVFTSLDDMNLLKENYLNRK